jgi:hypothetical protein
MHKDRQAVPTGTAESRGKRRWSAPTLSRIDAGAAEVGPRDQVDGTFTAS